MPKITCGGNTKQRSSHHPLVKILFTSHVRDMRKCHGPNQCHHGTKGLEWKWVFGIRSVCHWCRCRVSRSSRRRRCCIQASLLPAMATLASVVYPQMTLLLLFQRTATSFVTTDRMNIVAIRGFGDTKKSLRRRRANHRGWNHAWHLRTFARVSQHGHNPERRQKESTGEMCVRFLELTKKSTHSLIKNTVSSELFLVPSLLRHVSKSFKKPNGGLKKDSSSSWIASVINDKSRREAPPKSMVRSTHPTVVQNDSFERS